MSDTLITVVAILLAAILMFIFPMMSVAERSDDISHLSVQTATNEFVCAYCFPKNNEKVFTGYSGPFPKATGHEFDGLKKALEQDEKLWVDRMIILEDLHNLVKEHPFRTNNDNKYLVSYLKLLDKLLENYIFFLFLHFELLE